MPTAEKLQSGRTGVCLGSGHTHAYKLHVNLAGTCHQCDKVRDVFIKNRPHDKTGIHQACTGPTKQGCGTKSRRQNGLHSRLPRCYGDLQAWPDDSTGLENTFRLSCPSFIKTDTTSLSESPNVILQGLCLVFILQKGINPTFITFLLCIMSPSLGKK